MILLVAIAGVTVVPASNAQQPIQVQAPAQVRSTSIADLEEFIDGFVTAKIEDLDPPGMSVAVVTPDGVIAKGYGVADMDSGRMNDADTLFRIGSISKLFVWLSAHMLAEEGKLDLDADINTYLDGFDIPNSYDEPITMRDLMAHRAGFEDSLRDFLDSERDISLRDAAKRSMPRLVAPPGERASYSNYGTNLAAYVVEQAAGMDYFEFVHMRILQPAGMNATTLHDPGQGKNPTVLDERMARPHIPENGTATVSNYLPVRPQEPVGAVAISAKDAATFMQLMLRGTQLENGDRLLSEQVWARVQTNAFADAAGGDDMGWGFMLNEIDGENTIGHGGATKFLSWMFVLPDRGIGVFASSNMTSMESLPVDVAVAIVRRITGSDPVTRYLEHAGDVEAAEEVAGLYWTNRRTFGGPLALAGLGSEMTLTADNGFLVTSGPMPTRYAPIGNDVWIALDGSRLRVARDEVGEIVRLHGSRGSETYERVGFFQSSRPFLFATGLCMVLSITTLLGMWYRWRRPNTVTERGRKAMWIALVSALLWLAFAASLIALILDVSNIDLGADDLRFPPLPMKIMLTLIVALTIQCIVHIAGVWLAWTGSGWTLWQRVHFTIFAASFVFAITQFARFDLIGTRVF